MRRINNTTLPPWWQVTTPHKDIREGKLSEAIFAADLGDVVYGKAHLEYQDASIFFQKTYLTQGITNLLDNVLSRLSGGKGDAMIQLQTPFGGGKTHAVSGKTLWGEIASQLGQYEIIKEHDKKRIDAGHTCLRPPEARLWAYSSAVFFLKFDTLFLVNPEEN